MCPPCLSQGPLQAELPHEKQVRIRQCLWFRMSAFNFRFKLAPEDPGVACPMASQLHTSRHLAQAAAWSPSLLHSLTQA